MIEVSLFGVMALAAVWGGYPLVVRALGGLRHERRLAPASPTPGVSIIVASCDDDAAIRSRVADLLRADYPADRLEVIVALDAAGARASASFLADLDGRVRVLTGDAPGGKAATLNAGVRAARHELLVFADTAQRFDSDAIAQLVRALDDPSLGAVSGSLDLPGEAGALNLAERYWRYERWLRYWEGRLHSSVGVTGAIYAMRRALWAPLPAGLILDDVYVPMRLVMEGWKVGFTERARAREVRRFAARQEFRRKVRTLTGNLQLCAWLPGVTNPLRNPIWFQFVFHKLLRLLTPYFAALAVFGAVGGGLRALVGTPNGEQILLLAGMLLSALLLVPRIRRPLVRQVGWAIALQGSIIVATVNGARGRWNVWQ